MKILIQLIAVMLLAGHPINKISAQHADNRIFEVLDLDYPGLENVKAAVRNEDYIGAKDQLLQYFRQRSNRRGFTYGGEQKTDLKEAAENAKNIFTIKNLKYDFGKHIDWTKIFPDKEWQFSLGRMNWFANFVAVYKESGNEEIVDAWMNQIQSWTALNDPGYPRTIDTGRRLTNWVGSHWMLVTQMKANSVTAEFNAQMLFSMYEQAEFLYNPDNWRRYSNWGTFENAGLANMAVMFPEFKRSSIWLREIFFRMHFQLTNSFHPDGMHIEVSPSYHSHELEVWYDFYELARKNDLSNPWHSQIQLPDLKGQMLKIAEALMYWYKPTGVVPQVGDTDERDERWLLESIGRNWERPDFIYAARNGQLGRAPEKTSVAYPQGGYYIMRSGWGNKDRSFNDEAYLLFDCGTNNPWHAHFDALNIVATANGKDLLKDPGRFTYNDGPERDEIKSTAAHNTIVVDGKDQAQRYFPSPALWLTTHSFDYVSGVSDAYNKTIHRRSVFFVKPGYWIIIDRMSSKDSHRYDQYWHLSEDVTGKLKLDQSGKLLTTPDMILAFAGDPADVLTEERFLSYQYRQKVKAPVLKRTFADKTSIITAAVLYPYRDNQPELTVRILPAPENLDSQDVLILHLSVNKKNVYFMERTKGGEKVQFADYSTDARVVFVEMNSGQEIDAVSMVQGGILEHRGKTIIDLKNPEATISIRDGIVDLQSTCLQDVKLRFDGISGFILNGRKSSAKMIDGHLKINSLQPGVKN